MAHEHQSNSAVRRCGETTIELTGAPIQSMICCCEICRTAGREFERDLGVPQTVDADVGVDYCLYRKDRVKIAHGAHQLRQYRLNQESPVRRVWRAAAVHRYSWTSSYLGPDLYGRLILHPNLGDPLGNADGPVDAGDAMARAPNVGPPSR